MLRHSNDDLEIAVPRILRARTPWKNYIAIELEKHKEACNVSRKKKKKELYSYLMHLPRPTELAINVFTVKKKPKNQLILG